MTALRLHPMIRRTPGQDPSLPSAVRVANQRRSARELCHECAHVLGHPVRHLLRDEHGLPAPCDGWYWAVSHTRCFVAGIVAPFPVGLSVERVRHRTQELVRVCGGREEYEMLGGFRWQTFARLLSAKAAVLHKEGRPLADVSSCRVAAVPSDHGIVVHLDDRTHFVFQRFSGGHYASVCAELPGDADLEWDWSDLPPHDTPAA